MKQAIIYGACVSTYCLEFTHNNLCRIVYPFSLRTRECVNESRLRSLANEFLGMIDDVVRLLRVLSSKKKFLLR